MSSSALERVISRTDTGYKKNHYFANENDMFENKNVYFTEFVKYLGVCHVFEAGIGINRFVLIRNLFL